ncbi:fibrinogen-like YCDxxxxGGGW domain-containing protein [Rothia sp. LK2588]|uniref:fibrinogen-like YCDxxxxGGGW domain-containing protein n=1 Tax=Rothia sp. LK2588 TaxID=3114369 RepID=UPI0034CE6FDC
MSYKTLSRGVLASLAALTVTASMLPVTGAVAAPRVDGKSAETAAASCYEIKQNDPNSISGTYWLFTPQMQAPAQFYCDQETNGGGWVMIGRGREGWSEDYAGRGNPAELHKNPDGTDAFSPVQLDSATVNELLGGQRVDQLADGVRFRRAANTTGTVWQDAYAKRAHTESWSWALRATADWNDVRFDNPTQIGADYYAGNTTGFIGDWGSRYNTLIFNSDRNTQWKNGFNYGYYIMGNTSADSYLWSAQGNYAQAFTQVFVRPKLTQDNAGFAAIGDNGLAAEAKRQLPNSYSAPMRWRTSTESGTGVESEMNTRVQAISEVNGTVFTGGDFKNVVSASGEVVNQAFLAGYDVKTGELVRTFTPTFNGQVKAVEGLSNGKLAVGGEFSTVNGEPAAGFVVLDPVTGEIDRTFDWKIENRLVSGTPQVKSIQEINGYLYIGGAFTHVKGNTSATYTYARSAARFRMDNGSVDWNWRPNFNGTVNGINAAEDQSAVYAAGYFSTLGGEPARKLAEIDPNNGTRKRAWDWKLSYISTTNPDRAGFQFDVQDAASTVFTGGAEHLVAQYNKSDLSRASSSITKSGGDFQDLYRDKTNGTIFAGCHCGDWIYEGSETFNSPWSESDNIHSIRLLAAIDDQTGKVIPEFEPNISGQKGYGVWESFKDSQGVLWVGGDIVRSLGSNGVQNTVGFARFTPADVTPAAAPRDLKVTSDGTRDTLTWTPGTAGKTAFEILRDDRVIATVPAGTTTYSVDHTDGARYFVRSVDSAGNYSATAPVATAVVDPNAPAPQEPTPAPNEPTPAEPAPAEPTPAPTPTPEQKAADKQVVAMGDQWNYMKDAWYTPLNWMQPDVTVSGWRQANAAIGWNTTNLTTNIWKSISYQPISMYLRKDVTIDNPGDYTTLEIKVRSDDGSIIYVNGEEVKRDNLPSGTVYAYTHALQPKSDADAQDNLVTVQIPADKLRTGKNTIAVSTHAYNNYNARASFDLSATLKN